MEAADAMALPDVDAAMRGALLDRFEVAGSSSAPPHVGDVVVVAVEVTDGDARYVRLIRMEALSGAIEGGNATDVDPDVLRKIERPEPFRDWRAAYAERLRTEIDPGERVPVFAPKPMLRFRNDASMISAAKLKALTEYSSVFALVEVFNERLDLLERRGEWLPARAPEHALFANCGPFLELARRGVAYTRAEVRSLPAEERERHVRASVGTVLTAWNLTYLAWRAEKVEPLLRRVRPSLPWLWMLITGQRIELDIDVSQTAELGAVAAPAGCPPPRRVRLVLKLGERDKLWCDLYVVPPTPPLNLTAGVVAVEVTLPDEPEKRLKMRVIGAERGATLPDEAEVRFNWMLDAEGGVARPDELGAEAAW